MKCLRDEARGTSTTDMNGDDRRPRRFTLAELWAAPSRCARQASATSSTRLAQLVRTRTDAGTVDRPTPQVESCSRSVLSFWPEAKARSGTTPARPELRVGGYVCKSASYYSSLSSSLAPQFHPRHPAFMFLLSPIIRSLYLARMRLPEAVRGRLFPSTSNRISILLDAPNPARRDRGPFTAAADKHAASLHRAADSWKQLQETPRGFCSPHTSARTSTSAPSRRTNK